MKEKVLSVFIDESGDFGQYNPASPNYYVAMVLHNQEIDISKNIETLERQVSNWGYPEHTIHTGPLIRRESVYKNDLREQRKALFTMTMDRLSWHRFLCLCLIQCFLMWNLER